MFIRSTPVFVVFEVELVVGYKEYAYRSWPSETNRIVVVISMAIKGNMITCLSLPLTGTFSFLFFAGCFVFITHINSLDLFFPDLNR